MQRGDKDRDKASVPSQPPNTWHSLGSALSFVLSSPLSQLINYEEIFDLLLCLTRRILIKSHSGFGSFTSAINLTCASR